MPESLRSRIIRWRINFFPAYRGTGGRVRYLSADLREARVEVPLNRRTRNYVGTVFGGSLYGAVDPIYMLLLIWNLGREYVVWDKAATIRFRRPGRGSLHAHFVMTEEELEAIRREVDERGRTDRRYEVELVDAEGTVHATVEKVVHVRRRGERGITAAEREGVEEEPRRFS